MTAAAPTLFDWDEPALPTRASDPVTSRMAAKRLRLRKRKAETMRAIGSLVSAEPGPFTADEVYDVLRAVDDRWERGWVASRLSQLGEDRLIVRRGVADGRFETPVMTWWLTGTGRAWLDEDQA
jgi:hypothetical protein